MTSRATDEQTRREWRELEFFYDVSPETKEWHIVGSRSGIDRFGDLLIRYSADARNAGESEHDHRLASGRGSQLVEAK
jgi:hypothetical protein